MLRKDDIIRKKLHRLFNKFGFKLDIQTHFKITDYLDVTFNLYNGTVTEFRKHNQVPSYINSSSNHPKQVFKHMVRLSTNSSNSDIFTQNKHEYEAALKTSGHKTKLVYKSRGEIVNLRNRNKKPRKILWFTPPYNMAIANKVG